MIKQRHSIQLLIFALVLLQGCTARYTQDSEDSALVNQVEASPWITTAGQPSKTQLMRMARSNFELVINLLPADSDWSVPDEEQILRRKGIDYAYIPVDAEVLTIKQFATFSDLLNHYREKKVLVHCEANMRASVFTFMYQVIHEKMDPDIAYENITVIWIPGNRWKDFVNRVFMEHSIDYRI